MGLREKGMVKSVLGNTDLTLEASPGESFQVTDIFIHNPAGNYLTAKVDKTTVGYFRTGGQLGSHLAFPSKRTEHAHDITTSATAAGDQTSFASPQNAGGVEIIAKMLGGLAASTTYRRFGNYSPRGYNAEKTILGFLKEKAIFSGYPIATGQKMTLSGAAQANAIQIVTYDRYDEADIVRDMPNGSDATEYLYVNYGQSGAAINANGDTHLNTPNNPKEFHQFPFGADVPANVVISLFGLLCSDFAPKENDGTNYCLTQYMKMYRDRMVLFDKDKNGIPIIATASTALGACDAIAEGFSLAGNFSDVDARLPLMFDPALEFVSGEELNLYWNILKAGTGQNISTAEQEIAFIQKVSRK